VLLVRREPGRLAGVSLSLSHRRLLHQPMMESNLGPSARNSEA